MIALRFRRAIVWPMRAQKSMSFCRFPVLTVVCLTFAVEARASLLVYESYNGYNNASLTGQAATGTGLTGSYAFNGTSSTQSFTVQTGGLAFGSLNSTSGKSVRGSSTDLGATSEVKLALAASPVIGTLYSSYLINFITLSSAGGLGELRAVSATGDTGGSSRFRSAADQTGNSTATPGNAYDSTFTSGANNLTVGTTYLVVGRFTNVGTALSVGTSGQGTTFIMTAAQYASFLAGGADDNYLDSASVGSLASNITAKAVDAPVTGGTLGFASNNFIQVGIAASSTTNGTQSFDYDEVRFGTTLSAVTQVPEPGVVSLLAAAGLVLARRRRKVAVS